MACRYITYQNIVSYVKESGILLEMMPLRVLCRLLLCTAWPASWTLAYSMCSVCMCFSDCQVECAVQAAAVHSMPCTTVLTQLMMIS